MASTDRFDPGKRETALIDRSIMKRTEQVFPEEIRLILASTNLMRRITSISKDASREFSTNPVLSAIMNLFARNRELIHFSTVCFANGGYASSKVLVRVGLENSLYMRLFRKKPELARDWFSDPERFRREWSPRRIRDELFQTNPTLRTSYSEFYWVLSNYSHPSFKGWSEQIIEHSILWHQVFNADYASECMGLIFFIIVQSCKQFAQVFKQWIPDQMVAEINSLLPRDSQMVRRHFVVIKNGRLI
jgi:hypothetical protein